MPTLIKRLRSALLLLPLRCCALVLVGILLIGPAPAARDAGKVLVSPHGYVTRPEVVKIDILIERDPRNRGAEVLVVSDDYFASSWIELEGDAAPFASHLEFRHLPLGPYTVDVRLVRLDRGKWSEVILHGPSLEVR